MKKVMPICLAVLLLLNVMGYYGIFLGLRYRNAQELIQRLDAENYNESETVTIKVPLSVPYFGDTEFERVDGEIEYEGEFYRLVKQKLEKDTLYIVCIHDVRSSDMQQALKDYVRTFTDHAGATGQSKAIPSFIKDYLVISFSLGHSVEGWSRTLLFGRNPTSLPVPFITHPSRPPEC